MLRLLPYVVKYGYVLCSMWNTTWRSGIRDGTSGFREQVLNLERIITNQNHYA